MLSGDREDGKGTGLEGHSVFPGSEVGWNEDKISPPVSRPDPEPTPYRPVMEEELGRAGGVLLEGAEAPRFQQLLLEH